MFRLSLYDTCQDNCLKRSLRPKLSKNPISLQRLTVTNLCVCAAIDAGFYTGGASRDRTDDPLLAKQVLSQLSYGPKAVAYAPVSASP